MTESYDEGWKAGMLEAEKLLAPKDALNKEHVRNLLKAIRWARDVGCIDHLDCADNSFDNWEVPIEKAQAYVDGKEYIERSRDE